MKTTRNFHRILWLSLCALGAAFLPLGNAAAQNQRASPDGPAIMFLHLRASPAGFELLDVKVVPGFLKAPRYDSARGGLHFEMLAHDGLEPLFQDVCDEPTVTRLEWEDPNEPGRLRSKEIVSQTAEFTIRIPYSAKAQKVRFYRRPTGLAAAGMTEQQKSTLEFAGEITLPATK